MVPLVAGGPNVGASEVSEFQSAAATSSLIIALMSVVEGVFASSLSGDVSRDMDGEILRAFTCLLLSLSL